MIGRIRNSLLVIAIGASLALLGTSTPVDAKSDRDLSQQVDHFEQMLDELAKRDERGTSSKDRKRAREALKKARELLAQGSSATASWLLKRVQNRIELIRKLVKIGERRTVAERHNEKYKRLKEQMLPEIESDIEELRKKKEKLQKRLEELER